MQSFSFGGIGPCAPCRYVSEKTAGLISKERSFVSNTSGSSLTGDHCIPGDPCVPGNFCVTGKSFIIGDQIVQMKNKLYESRQFCTSCEHQFVCNLF